MLVPVQPNVPAQVVAEVVQPAPRLLAQFINDPPEQVRQQVLPAESERGGQGDEVPALDHGEGPPDELPGAAGHLGRILLGLDLGQRDYFRAYGGGPGLAYLMEAFVPRLRRRIGDAAVDVILVANAASAFAMSR